MPGSASAALIPTGGPPAEDAAPTEWIDVVDRGFGSCVPLRIRLLAYQCDATRRVARVDGRLAGGGLLTRRPNRVALFSSTSVLTEYRGRGLHGALFRDRLQIARGSGAETGAFSASPDTVSARNALRWGFVPAGLRTLYERRR